jgi:hypothetical protein
MEVLNAPMTEDPDRLVSFAGQMTQADLDVHEDPDTLASAGVGISPQTGPWTAITISVAVLEPLSAEVSVVPLVLATSAAFPLLLTEILALPALDADSEAIGIEVEVSTY